MNSQIKSDIEWELNPQLSEKLKIFVHDVESMAFEMLELNVCNNRRVKISTFLEGLGIVSLEKRSVFSQAKGKIGLVDEELPPAKSSTEVCCNSTKRRTSRRRVAACTGVVNREILLLHQRDRLVDEESPPTESSSSDEWSQCCPRYHCQSPLGDTWYADMDVPSPFQHEENQIGDPESPSVKKPKAV
ncbi:Hypothetical predicted protein [Olea europaea subsp. europaea]|uniref:Uncharacterized protein n=1 Tax=Olea europaea subsp. europaea TaxID=158383 RepID=A0A8S0PCX8_OLEEU|nr:Hypothetical predicted protein [Olea europaea subsp. europaea]